MISEIESVIDYMDKIELDEYWNGFSAVAFAFYDNEAVYLFNHPQFSRENKSFTRLKWSTEFNGADTLILFHDYPTAIINLEYHQHIESLYSILVHELFHGFQFLKNEKRFPNEVLGFRYPIMKENIEWRNKERLTLFHAVIEDEEDVKRRYIREFIAIREKRKSIIGEFLDYENLVETVEGPAWYVELLAKHRVSNLPLNEVLNDFSDFLIDKTSSNLHIRRSCYASGLFICFILDELAPNWKSDFQTSELSLYDYLKEYVKEGPLPLGNEQISKETDEIYTIIKRHKEEVFSNFLNQDGYKVVLEGEIKTVLFDPMNIVYEEKRILHQKSVKVKLKNKEYLLQQPVLACFNDDYKNATRLELFLAEKPIFLNGILHINGIGEMQGEIMDNGQIVYVKV